ncbi:MAG: hypothetical protein QOG54_2191 [Actinomycetota bacterium]|jgi:hypothetical protein|nr:hypothetical protein [Actinomycetota bacterium]
MAEARASTDMDRRTFLRRTAVVATMTPLILSVTPGRASAQVSGCIVPGQPCTQGGIPCCSPATCTQVSPGVFICVI